jgi:hypothetical protein
VAAALVITRAVEVPTDHQIQDWTAATLPTDWRSTQSHWQRWHTTRTFLSIAALITATISTAVAARPNEPQHDREAVMDDAEGSRL